MDAGQLKRRLAEDPLTIASMLLPKGRKHGSEWCCGSVDGEAGESLKVHLTGRKAGLWADFSTDAKGDLIDLWRLVKRQTMGEALADIRAYLGVQDHRDRFQNRREYKRPAKPECRAPQSDVLAYLTGDRKLSPETVKAFQVAEKGRDIVFPYKRGDELVMWKTISIDRPEGKKQVRVSKDSEPILFGWQAIDPNASYVVICEGEIDAMTVHQYGHPALSVPFGAGGGDKQKWVDSEYHALEQFRDIYLCMDSDPVGREAAEEIASRLGRHRCRMIDLGFKDPNEALLFGVGPEWFAECLKGAETLDPEVLKSAGKFTDQVERLWRDKDKPQNHITLPWAKTHSQVQLMHGQLTVWMGYNGHGKSELLLQVMAHRMTLGDRVCIASLEVPAADLIAWHLVPMLSAMAEPSSDYRREICDWLDSHLWLFDLVGTAKGDQLLEVFKYAHARYGISHFVLDSLLKVGLGEDDYNGQKFFVEKLCDFKNQTKACVHLVAHSRKKDDGESKAPTKHDTRGSSSIVDLADNMFVVYRNKPKELALWGDPEDEEEVQYNGKKLLAKEVRLMPDAMLNCHKQRQNGLEPQFGLWFDRGSRQFLGKQTHQPKRYVSYKGSNA